MGKAMSVASDATATTINAMAVAINPSNGMIGGSGGGGRQLVGCGSVTQDDVHVWLINSLWLFVGYPVLALGMLSCMLTLVVLCASPTMRSLPTTAALIVMSLAGLCALLSGLLPAIIEYQTCAYVRLGSLVQSRGCAALMTFVHFAIVLHAWTEACAAVERLWRVRSPLAYVCCCASGPIVGFSLCLAAILPTCVAVLTAFEFGLDSRGLCTVSAVRLVDGLSQYTLAAVYAVVPLTIMIICDGLLLQALSCYDELKSDAMARDYRQMSVAHLFVNFVFACTVMPVMIYQRGLLNDPAVAAPGASALDVVWVLVRLLIYLRCGAGFIMYVALRRETRSAISEAMSRVCGSGARLSPPHSSPSLSPEGERGTKAAVSKDELITTDAAAVAISGGGGNRAARASMVGLARRSLISAKESGVRRPADDLSDGFGSDGEKKRRKKKRKSDSSQSVESAEGGEGGDVTRRDRPSSAGLASARPSAASAISRRNSAVKRSASEDFERETKKNRKKRGSGLLESSVGPGGVGGSSGARIGETSFEGAGGSDGKQREGGGAPLKLSAVSRADGTDVLLSSGRQTIE